MEYPPPPSSPSKINRSRIKPIPRLHQRKTSFSASESEDETRRQYSRIRNDSVSFLIAITKNCQKIGYVIIQYKCELFIIYFFRLIVCSCYLT